MIVTTRGGVNKLVFFAMVVVVPASATSVRPGSVCVSSVGAVKSLWTWKRIAKSVCIAERGGELLKSLFVERRTYDRVNSTIEK